MEAWRRRFFDDYRELDDQRIAIEKDRATVLADVPRTMVMSERQEPRPSYILMRVTVLLILWWRRSKRRREFQRLILWALQLIPYSTLPGQEKV